MARRIEVELVGDARSLTSAFTRTQTASSRLERNLGRLGHMTKLAIGTGVGVGLVGLAFAAHGAIKEFEQAQAATAQTNAVIKSTGGAANVTAKHVNALSNSLLRKTGIDDEVVQAGENMLLTFRNVRNEVGKGNDIFDQATKVGLDMSTALKGAGFEGGSLQTTMIRLGKALNDPVQGMTALKRVGVTFNKAQQDTIKHLESTGHHLEAQKLILRELTAEFGGSAAAYGKTLPGQLMIFRESLRNVGAYIVGKFIPVMTGGMKVVERFGHFIGQIAHAKNLEVGLKVTAAGIKNFANTVKDALSRALFGFSDQATAGGPVVDKGLAGFAGRFHDGLVQKLMKQDWKAIGGQIAAGISSSLTFSADALNGMLNTMLAWASSHTGKIAEVGILIALAIATKLTDPGFWVHHMGLLAGVMLLAFGGSIGRAAGRFGGQIIAKLGPVFRTRFATLATIAAVALERLPGKLGAVIIAAASVVSRATGVLWRAVVGETSRGVGAAAHEAGRLATLLARTFRLTAAVAAIRTAVSLIGGAFQKLQGPINTVIGWVKRLIHWLSSIPHDISVHIHIPVPHIPHIGLPHVGNPFGAAGGQVVGGIRGKDSVGAILMPGEVVVPVPLVSQHGGPEALMDKLGFQRMAKGGIAGKGKKHHHAPKLPESIRLAEARAAGTPGLGDDITAKGRELAWVNQELGRHDLTTSERGSLKVRRVRVQTSLRKLRSRKAKQSQHDYSQLPAGLALAISNARLAVAEAVSNQQIVQANSRLRAALWDAKHWLERQLRRKLTQTQRAAVIDAIASITDEIKGITDPTGEDAGGDNADLQAQLDQERARSAASAEAARLANDFVATGVFGGGGGGAGGGGGGPGGGRAAGGAGHTFVFNSLFPYTDEQARQAAAAAAQGAGRQPYRSSSVVKTTY